MKKVRSALCPAGALLIAWPGQVKCENLPRFVAESPRCMPARRKSLIEINQVISRVVQRQGKTQERTHERMREYPRKCLCHKVVSGMAPADVTAFVHPPCRTITSGKTRTHSSCAVNFLEHGEMTSPYQNAAKSFLTSLNDFPKKVITTPYMGD